MDDGVWDRLQAAAEAARRRAYAPYSGFAVGAALLAENGEVIAGCNVENASYGLTNCAERTALFTMAARGLRTVRALAVVADSPRAVPPCGACRQALAEFGCADTPLLLANLAGERVYATLGELLPLAFSGKDLRA